MWPNPQFPAALVIFTEGILNRKLHFCATQNGVSESFKRKVINSLIAGKWTLWGNGR